MKKFFIVNILLSVAALGLGCERAPDQPAGQGMGTNVTKESAQQTSKSAMQGKPVSPDTKEGVAAGADTFKPFFVYGDKSLRENHFIPSGFMPNGKCIIFADDWKENCHNGSTCVKVVYDVECSRNDEKW